MRRRSRIWGWMKASTAMHTCCQKTAGSRHTRTSCMPTLSSSSGIRTTRAIKRWPSGWGCVATMLSATYGRSRRGRISRRMGFGGGCWWRPGECRRRLWRWWGFCGEADVSTGNGCPHALNSCFTHLRHTHNVYKYSIMAELSRFLRA